MTANNLNPNDKIKSNILSESSGMNGQNKDGKSASGGQQ